MKKRGNFQQRFRLRNLLRQFKRELALALWSKLIHDHIMNGRGTPAMLNGVCSGGVVYGTQLAMIGDDPNREEKIIPSEVLDRIDVTTRLRGEDIFLATERAKIKRNEL